MGLVESGGIDSMSNGFRLAYACAMVAGASAASAEVADRSATGFTVHQAAVVAAPPARAYAAFTDIGKWWDGEHTYSGDARNLSLDPVPRGCFCEKLSLYAGIEHAHVVYAQPAKTLRLVGALGPLQEFGVSGALTWQIEAAGGGSKITVTYNVGGFADRPLADWAPIVDEVVGGQVKRLARFVVTGNPAEQK